ncbi:MAG: glycosyltransferase family 2 protein [Kovacikia sp.]
MFRYLYCGTSAHIALIIQSFAEEITVVSTNTPRVSIGLAVYNGENYIRDAIDSILAQTFQDFELIISDNASTDKTQEICQSYAAQDQRIRYYRNPYNLGGQVNQNCTMELAQGEYFKLAAHDDLIAPRFLEKCVEILDDHPEVVLCYPKTQLIDQDGKEFEAWDGDPDPGFSDLFKSDIQVRTDSSKPQERLAELFRYRHYWYPIFGVIRMSTLRKTPLFSTYAGADGVLLGRLLLLGTFYEVPETLFFLRRHSGQSLNIGAISPQLYSIWFSTANKGKLTLPFWSSFFEFGAAVRTTPLSWQERIACYAQILQATRRAWKALLKELLISAVLLSDWSYRKVTRIEIQDDDSLLFGRYPRLN